MPAHLAIDAVGIKHSGGAIVLLDFLAVAISDPRIDKITLFCSPRHMRNFELPISDILIEIAVPRAEQSYLYRIWWRENLLGKECETVGADVLLCMAGMGAKFPVPYVTYIQQSLPFSKEALDTCGLLQRLRMRVIKRLMQHSCRRSSKIVVQTPTMAEWISTSFDTDRNRIESILPYPQPLPSQQSSSSNLIQMRAIPKNRRLLYVGSQACYKNLEIMLEGMYHVRYLIPEATLFLTCPADHPFCKQEGIVGLGYLNRAELREAYELATCLIQPSFVESANLPLLEAMLIGTPVLVADRPYARDECGQAAMFFDPLNSEDFSSKAVAIMKDEILQFEMINKGTLRMEEIQQTDQYGQLIDCIMQAKHHSVS